MMINIFYRREQCVSLQTDILNCDVFHKLYQLFVTRRQTYSTFTFTLTVSYRLSARWLVQSQIPAPWGLSSFKTTHCLALKWQKGIDSTAKEVKAFNWCVPAAEECRLWTDDSTTEWGSDSSYSWLYTFNEKLVESMDGLWRIWLLGSDGEIDTHKSKRMITKKTTKSFLVSLRFFLW